ncbi:MAG: helix-turn-helix domain-containing protein [Balneolales bacterium]
MPTLIEDIKAIRKYKKVSLNELYEKTKVPAHIIEMIDNGTIFTENPNNKIYIRSFIRTYAKGLGISNDDIIQALDDHEVDVYEGFLADKYINKSGGNSSDRGGIKPSGPLPSTGSSQTSSEKKAEADRKVEEKSKKEGKNKGDDRKQKDTPSGEANKAVLPNNSLDDDRYLDAEDEKIRQTKSTHTAGHHSLDLRPDITKPYNLRTPEPPSISSVDWADTVKRFNPLENNSKMYLTFASVFCVILIAFFAFYAFRADIFPLNFNLGNGSTADLDEAVQLPIAPDTLEDDNEDVSEVAQAEELADTLGIIIYAANDKLEPVRVQTDINNILTPYWIEEGEAIHTKFVDEILIRGEYSQMELVFNGQRIEDIRSFSTEDQFIRISRDFLNEDPKWKMAMTDSIPSGMPPPSIIREASGPLIN